MSGIEDLLGKDLLGQINNGNDEAQGETEIKDPEQEEYVKRKIPNDQKKESESNKPQYVQRYSQDGYLAEAVLIVNVPYFLVSKDGEISIEKELNTPSGIRKPLEASSYLNRPYSFNSKEEVQDYIKNTTNETLDTLYRKVKSIWSKYLEADNFHLTICTADTIFTLFQDKMGLTHYLYFVGNNGSGKSNNLKVFQILAYRNMMSTDITAANIYQFLGSDEEGIGTICEDEADTIDDYSEKDKMKIYKNGYTTGSPVFRTDTSFGRKQYKYNTFLF